MDDGSVNESGSEQSLPSSKSSVSDSKKKKMRDCDICGKYVDQDLMMSRFRDLNTTQEQFHPSSFWSASRKLRICYECYSLTRVLKYPDQDAIDKAASSSRTNQAVDNKEVQQKTTSDSCNESDTSRTTQAASSSRTNQVVDNEVVKEKTTSDSCNEISATNPPSQTHPRLVVEEASPPMKKQKKSDNDVHSDSESAK